MSACIDATEVASAVGFVGCLIFVASQSLARLFK